MIIRNIRQNFIKEAEKSPLLFSDLANMEKYISESYDGRSLIELIQNADDAISSEFLIEKIKENIFIVANNGREFTEEDLISLCRSGASTKVRGKESIGYRGIGFKSIVNYSEVVHLISGGMNVTFSKQLTEKVLNTDSDVPLIRVPHEFKSNLYNKEIEELKSKGFTTIFIFETLNQNIEDEIKAFDSTTMLFLDNLTKIIFESQSQEILVSRKNNVYNYEKINIKDSHSNSSWLLKRNKSNSALAYKYNNEKVIGAADKESKMHVFMPTEQKFSIPMKVNADFSTDPSRTKIVKDDITEKSLLECSSLLFEDVKNIFEQKNDEFGVINIINKGKINEFMEVSKFNPNDYIILNLHEKLKMYFNTEYNSKQIYLQPEGITNQDFITICQNLDIVGIGFKQEEKIPGIITLLKSLKFKELPSEIILESLEHITTNQNTNVKVIADIIKKTKFDLNNQLREKIAKSKIFKVHSGYTTLDKINDNNPIDEQFQNQIIELLPSINDYIVFLKSFGISISNERKELNNEETKEFTHKVKPEKKIFTTQKPSVKKWRSVETNLRICLEELDIVAKAIDVSKQNVGYDIELILNDNTKKFVEVKSVNNLGDSFTITNNEYSTANDLGENFIVAVVNQTEDEINVCYINNPIEKLNLQKRVTRWEWSCESYTGEMTSFKI